MKLVFLGRGLLGSWFWCNLLGPKELRPWKTKVDTDIDFLEENRKSKLVRMTNVETCCVLFLSGVIRAVLREVDTLGVYI